MVMRYVGGGIGHLKNTPLPQQMPIDSDPSSEETTVEEEDHGDDPRTCANEDLDTIVQQPSMDVVMMSEEQEVTEGNENDDEDSSDDSDGIGEDNEDDSGCSSSD
jgi:hypothetical protein